jgi:hypothetical protein
MDNSSSTFYSSNIGDNNSTYDNSNNNMGNNSNRNIRSTFFKNRFF